MFDLNKVLQNHKITRTWDRSVAFNCPLCGRKLKFKCNDGGRLVYYSGFTKFVVTNSYRCQFRGCPNYRGFTPAPVVWLPKRKFSLGVWTKVIKWRFKYKKAYTDIVEILREEDKILMDRSTATEICDIFEIVGAEEADAKTLKDVKENGAIVLSIDGTGDNDGGPKLWILSDRISGRVLHADIIEHASVDALGELMVAVTRKYNVPISYVISDRQETIELAVKKYLPGTPHQFCQFHFIGNLAKPVTSKDSDLHRKLKKKSAALTW